MDSKDPDDPRAPGDPELGEQVGQLFRRNAARMTAALARILGDLDLAEDLVSEALLRALKTWSWSGIPDNPDAWLSRVAKNLALDAVRHRRMTERKEQDLERWERDVREPSATATGPDPDELRDDLLRMIFASCHPSLGAESRVALTLKTLCGLGVGEIARALLSTEAAVEQRLTRAKARLKEEAVPFEMPAPRELDARLDSVLEVLYLMFNEGWSAHGGRSLVRADLLGEALRLCRLVLGMTDEVQPKVEALYALMLLTGARLPARVAALGEPLTLAEQDRSLWQRDWLDAGFHHFGRSIQGERLSVWHVEAAIASCHAMARTYADTDWGTILARYEQLVALVDNPVAHLNRAVAVAKVHGVDAGLRELDRLQGHPALAHYYLLPATRAQLHWLRGEHDEAARLFRAAAKCGTSEPEESFLLRRAARCEAREPPAPF